MVDILARRGWVDGLVKAMEALASSNVGDEYDEDLLDLTCRL